MNTFLIILATYVTSYLVSIRLLYNKRLRFELTNETYKYVAKNPKCKRRDPYYPGSHRAECIDYPECYSKVPNTEPYSTARIHAMFWSLVWPVYLVGQILFAKTPIEKEIDRKKALEEQEKELKLFQEEVMQQQKQLEADLNKADRTFKVILGKTDKLPYNS